MHQGGISTLSLKCCQKSIYYRHKLSLQCSCISKRAWIVWDGKYFGFPWHKANLMRTTYEVVCFSYHITRNIKCFNWKCLSAVHTTYTCLYQHVIAKHLCITKSVQLKWLPSLMAVQAQLCVWSYVALYTTQQSTFASVYTAHVLIVM